MKLIAYILLSIPMLLLAIVQFTIVPIHLLILLLFLVCWRGSEELGLVSAFLAGLFLDLVSGGTLGRTSLFFLGSALVIILYRRKFSFSHPLILLVFFILFDSFLQMMTSGKFFPIELVFFSVIIQLINLFFYQPEIRW